MQYRQVLLGDTSINEGMLAEKFGKWIGVEYMLLDWPAKSKGGRMFLPLYMAHLP